MTDSGTFQSYMYGDINIDPYEIVAFQRDIGCDVGTILDIFGTPDQTKKQAKKGIDITIERAKKSINIKDSMKLACPVQGSIYPDLRTKCAQELGELNADFFPIGGVVPLMENQRYSDLIQCIIAAKKGLPPGKPVHLFGAGHPLIFPMAVALGCDFFDSSAYVKYAQDDRLIFYWGTEKIDELTELPCSCPICSHYSISEIKNQEKSSRINLIAKHNLYVSFEEIRKIRNAISNGNLWEMVERRSHSNPHLLSAMKLLQSKDIKNYLEKYEPISKKKALFYTGTQTLHRPIVHRSQQRVQSCFSQINKTIIEFEETKKPYSQTYSKQIQRIRKKNPLFSIIVKSPLGPVPIELDETYPFAQSVIPIDPLVEQNEYLKQIYHSFYKDATVVNWRNISSLSTISSSDNEYEDFDIRRIRYVADYQFGKGAGDILLKGKIRFVKSKKTGKIRNIYSDDKHVLSMRASDGFFTLKIEGGRLLHDSFLSPLIRVIVFDDAVSFIREGKSVFAKFIKDADPGLRPFDECLIVDETDSFLGVGRCLLNRAEMLSFSSGVGVKTRESNNI
jgi:7-cyano-7-deazaguanine tRNA-ribosyltransferase